MILTCHFHGLSCFFGDKGVGFGEKNVHFRGNSIILFSFLKTN